MVPISKSTFLHFQVCPKDTWLRLHRQDFIYKFEPTAFDKHLMELGNEVELHARQLFPESALIEATGDEAVAQTRQLMDAGTGAIFQATFLADGFYTKCDVLKPGAEAGSWNIYEIKGTNSRKEGSEDRDHISDLAVQKRVLTLAGIKVGRAYIVHLNKDYVRAAALDVPALFTVADSTELVDQAMPDIAREMDAAREYLSQANEPGIGCDCHLYGRSRHCRTFSYSHPYVPEYSVHDIARIGASKKKLEQLVGQRIFAVADVPDDFPLSDTQSLQVRAHKSKQPIVAEASIAEQLGGFTFPLYFLDYETYAPAIPAFNGFSPYRRIPFQLSLHALRDRDSELEHVEFLHPERTDPTLAVAELLGQHIGPEGSIVVWSAAFERGVNKEIGERLGGAHATRMEAINARMKDLRDVFAKQHYVHPEFRGGTSIKDVLPVMVPELTYDGMAIRDGTMASERWWAMTAAETAAAERAAIAAALLAYCKQDSYAMYAIWRRLQNLLVGR
jgi:hypothetical protein